MPSASETLAAFAADLRCADLPAPVRSTVKRHVLDLLGVALAGGTMEFGRIAARVAQAMGGAPTCTVVGERVRLPAVWAALANGSFAHGLDFDDTHAESVVHVSTSVVPAALAACEEAGADGRTFLTAVALGMEANIRIGLVARGGFHDRGFHPTGICGTFASALVAGKVAGLSRAALAHALGIAGSQAAGSLEFLTDGSWAKRLHGGWAAHSGLIAARLAAAGFTGPRQILDGRFGLYRSHLGPAAGAGSAGARAVGALQTTGSERLHGDRSWDLSVLTAELGTRWELLDTSLKPYPCCHMNHAFLDGAAALRAAYAFSPSDIEEVECFISPREVPIVCEPAASKRMPQTDYDAKFSLPYTLASMLLRGHVDIDDFTPAAIGDAAVLDVAQRVVYHDDPDSDYPRHFPGRLRIRLRDGRVLEHHEPINRGSADRPLSDAEVEAKFRRNAARAVSAQHAAAVIAAVGDIERQPDLTALAAALAPA